MSEVQRFRRGPQKVYKGTVQAGTKVEVGDLVALVGAYVINAEASALVTAATFKAGFLGVLIEGATSGNETADRPCLVGTSGVYEYDFPAALGAGLTAGKPIAVNISGGVAQDQVVAAAADRTTAVALLAADAKQGDLTGLIDIYPALAGNALA